MYWGWRNPGRWIVLSWMRIPSHSGHLSDDRPKSGRFPIGIPGRIPSEYALSDRGDRRGGVPHDAGVFYQGKIPEKIVQKYP